MARQKIDVGEFPNDISAEKLWEAFVKAEENFQEIYRLLGLVKLQNYVKKAGDTVDGTLVVNRLGFKDNGIGVEINQYGSIIPKAAAAAADWVVWDTAGNRTFVVPLDGKSPPLIFEKDALHVGNGGGEVEDVPIYSTTKILATKPFRELFTTLDKNAQITLTLPADAVPQFAPTIMFHTLHKGAGWKLTFTQAVRWYGGVAPTQVTADNTFATWMFHYAKGVWLGSYNIAKA